MRMTAIHVQTERKRQDRSARCAEKHYRRARTQRLSGLIGPVSAARVTVEAAWRKKRLWLSQIQVIFTSSGTPLGECQLVACDLRNFSLGLTRACTDVLFSWGASKYANVYTD